MRCPAGMQSNDAQDNCEECPIATYSEGLTEANVKCDMCPAEHTTLTNGSANATDCFCKYNKKRIDLGRKCMSR